MMYLVTKLFTGGIFKGLSITEKTSVQFEVNKHYNNCIGGSSYKIISVEKL